MHEAKRIADMDPLAEINRNRRNWPHACNSLRG
jgi:hypothetical protein